MNEYIIICACIRISSLIARCKLERSDHVKDIKDMHSSFYPPYMLNEKGLTAISSNGFCFCTTSPSGRLYELEVDCRTPCGGGE